MICWRPTKRWGTIWRLWLSRRPTRRRWPWSSQEQRLTWSPPKTSSTCTWRAESWRSALTQRERKTSDLFMSYNKYLYYNLMHNLNSNFLLILLFLICLGQCQEKFCFESLKFTCTRLPDPIVVQPWFKIQNGIVTGGLDNLSGYTMRGLMRNDYEWDVIYEGPNAYTATVQFNMKKMQARFFDYAGNIGTWVSCTLRWFRFDIIWC